MKARELKKVVPTSGYTVHETHDKICIASPMCSDLLAINKETLKLTYALDTFREGRKALKSEGLTAIWDKLEELIKSGEIKYYIDGCDELKNPIPIYSIRDGNLIIKYTEELGWPNITHDGELMYENSFFKTKEEAIKYYIKTTIRGNQYDIERIEDNLKKELEHIKRLREENKPIFEMLKELGVFNV